VIAIWRISTATGCVSRLHAPNAEALPSDRSEARPRSSVASLHSVLKEQGRAFTGHRFQRSQPLALLGRFTRDELALRHRKRAGEQLVLEADHAGEGRAVAVDPAQIGGVCGGMKLGAKPPIQWVMAFTEGGVPRGQVCSGPQ
jgi:hypothetical protein